MDPLEVVVHNESGLDPPISQEVFERVVITALEHISKEQYAEKRSCSFVIVSGERMRTLNKQYRKHDAQTDVLAFPAPENEEEFGDVFLCPEYIRIRYPSQKAFQRAFLEAAVHGFLHLLGYDHFHEEGWEEEVGNKRGKEMAELTELIVREHLP